jgi:hypothetical protein
MRVAAMMNSWVMWTVQARCVFGESCAACFLSSR